MATAVAEPVDARARAAPGARPRERAADLALPVGLCGLTIWLGFDEGGYFADASGWAAAGVFVALATIGLLAGRLPGAMSRPLAAAAAVLALFGILTLISGAWSDAPARALIEFDRVLLYLGTLLLFGVAGSGRQTLRRLPPAFVLAAAVLCAAGLIVRALPDAWPWTLPPVSERMDYPLTYENALGLLAALGLILGLHVAAWSRSRATRVLAAAALPLFAAVLVLTFSRGATVAAVLGAIAYLLLSRHLGALTALLAAAPAVFVAARAAYGADLLATVEHRTGPAMAQGEDLALTVGLAMAGAALVMAVLTRAERTVLRARRPREGHRPRRSLVVAAVAFAAVGAGVAIVAFAPLDKLTHDSGTEEQTRDRLTDPGAVTNLHSQARVDYWRVSARSWEDHPVAGSGAGTFGQRWDRERPITQHSSEGHSLYIETLGELGTIGAVLLVALLAALLWPLLAGLRGPARPLYAAVTAAALAWLLHAGLDWDWEMPVVTLWLFAMCGAALAGAGRPVARRRPRSWVVPALAAAGCVAVALTPVTVALSQTRLNKGAAAFKRGDCAAAERSADSAIDILPVRAEGYALRAYCQTRGGRHDDAERSMRAAIARDPRNWEYHYGLALVRAHGGRDPRGDLSDARALNPREVLIDSAQNRLAGSSPRRWQRAARTLRLPKRLP
jgi:O-antigen ligase